MDILNFISWIKNKKQVTTVDPNKTLIPLGLKDPKRDDGYLSGAVSATDFINQVISCIPPSSSIVVEGTGTLSTLRCGANNTSSGDYSTALGKCNTASGTYSTISGGYINRVCASNSAILSGSANIVMDGNSSINGGMLNAIGCVTSSSAYSMAGCVTVLGDQTSQFSIGNCFAYYHDVDNRVYAGTITCSTYNGFLTELIGINPGSQDSFQGQGINFSTATASNIYGSSTIGGGYINIIEGARNTISGGYYNCALGFQSTISGGVFNSSNNNSFIGGGECNSALSFGSVSGGSRNTASGGLSTISGGFQNTASALHSGILGGSSNIASCACSFIVGSNITTDRACTTFVNNLSIKNIPTSSAGLPSGSIYRNGIAIEIVP
jgi:hypothetical protein